MKRRSLYGSQLKVSGAYNFMNQKVRQRSTVGVAIRVKVD